jgi:hypothetical protein
MIQLLTAAILIASFSSLSLAHGQEATEQFIPLGKSPGVSFRRTIIGNIEMIDPGKQTVTVAIDGKRHTVRVSDQTKIWLDRTPLNRSNISGAFSDLQAGRKIEVKFADEPKREVAEWIKIEMTESGSEDHGARNNA